MQAGLPVPLLLPKTEECEGPDLIYLPEVPFDIDRFLVKVKELLKKKSSIVIAVSEGIKLADGRYVCELGNVGDCWEMPSDISSCRVQLLIWPISWQQSVDARPVQWSFLLYKEVHPIWHPGWTLTKHLW